MGVFLTCEESEKLCDKHQYDKADRWDSIKLRFHLLVCKCCRDYSNNTQKLSECIKSAKIQYLDEVQKKSLRSKLEQHLSNHPHS